MTNTEAPETSTTDGSPLTRRRRTSSPSGMRPAMPARRPGAAVAPADRSHQRPRLPAAVGPDGHVRREEAQERLQVTADQGGQEPLGHRLPHRETGLVARPPGLDVLPGPVGDLTDRDRRAAEDLRDLGMGVPEHLVEHEHGPLQRRQRLEDHKQRHRQRLGPLGGGGRVPAIPRDGRDERLGQPRPDVRLAAALDRGLAGHGLVDRDPDQVGARVADRLGGRGPAPGRPGQPGLLEDVLGVGDRAEQVVDHGEQQLALVQERLGRPVRRDLAGHVTALLWLSPVESGHRIDV